MNTQKGQVTAAQFLSLFGNGQICLARHGKAIPSTKEHPDYLRVLAPQGEFQATSLHGKFLGESFDLITASRAVRARQTTCLATGCSEADIYGEITAFVIDDDDTTDLNRMFAVLKYSSLLEYHKHELAAALHKTGYDALCEILDLTAAKRTDGRARVWVGGHAVFHPQVVHTIGVLLLNESFTTAGLKLIDQSMKMSLGEAEVIVMTFNRNENDLDVKLEIVKPDPAKVEATLVPFWVYD